MPDVDPVKDGLNKFADHAVKAASAGWWSTASSAQKLAVAALVGAACLGPLGQGLAGLFRALYSPQVPSAQQVLGVFLLALLTLPVFASFVVGVGFAGRPLNGPVTLLMMGLVAVVGAALTRHLAFDSLRDFYCYNNGAVLEHQCRDFNYVAFNSAAAASGGGPAGAVSIIGNAFLYTADARGIVMAVAGLIGGVGAGMLIRLQER